MDTAAILNKLRKEKRITQSKVAAFLTENGCPVTNKAVSKWETGLSGPDVRQFLLLCRLYDVRDVLDVFFDMPPEVTKDEFSAACLNSAGRERLAEYVRFLSAQPEFSDRQPESRQSVRKLPLYELPVSAGTGQFLDSDVCELIDVDASVPAAASYAVRISGDSMMPRFIDRQIVYVKQQQTLQNDEIGIFLLNGDAYCKKLSAGFPPRLISLNPKYKPIVIVESDELHVLGRVLS